MEQLQIAIPQDHLLAIELVLIQAILAVVLDNSVVNLRKQRGEFVILRLRPAIKWVVVAAGTLQANPQKNLGDRFRSIIRSTNRPVKIRWRIFVGAALCRDNLLSESIEGLALE
jgi:hypothetical protein